MSEKLQELKALRGRMEKELRENILNYWIKYTIQPGGKGFYGAVDLSNKPVEGADKTCVVNTRILWTFAEAALVCGDKKYSEVADLAFQMVAENFLDNQHGGFFMSITDDNQISNDIKHTYAQAFGIYALAKYFELRKDEKAASLMRHTFELLEEKAKDKNGPGYFEGFSRDWKPIENNRMADDNEPKSMNTHLHVLEGYAGLYKVWKDEKVKTRLSELLNIFMDRVVRDSGHFGIFFDENFQEVEASKGTCSFGHDIEGSWLVWEASEILGDKKILDRLQPIVTKIVDSIEQVAVDKNGGLFLESRRYGSHVRTNKHWWPQAETVVGFMNAYQLVGDEKYLDTMLQTWSFIDENLVDHEGGEWFTKLNRLGKPYLVEPADDPSPFYRNDRKVDPWKGPYHNGRMCMEMIRRIDAVIKT